MRFSNVQLRDLALAAVEEAAKDAVDGQVRKTRALAFALAYLANGAEERWPFDAIWREALRPVAHDGGVSTFGRHQSITNAMNGIYVQLGVKRRWEER